MSKQEPAVKSKSVTKETAEHEEAKGGGSLELLKFQSERAAQTFSSPLESEASYRHHLAVAKLFSDSMFVPDSFKGKPGNCLIAMNLAKSMGEDPLRVMQAVYVVGGRPAFYTDFMVARANRLAGFKSHIRWNVERLEPKTLKAGNHQMPNLRVTAYAKDEFGELIEESVTTEMAISDGWAKNPKYQSIPERMLKWRAASALIRMYCPDVMYGMTTVEEAITLDPESIQVLTEQPTVTSLAAGVGQPAPTNALERSEGAEGAATNPPEAPSLPRAPGSKSGAESAAKKGAGGEFCSREAVAKLKLHAKKSWSPKIDLEKTFLAVLGDLGIEGPDKIPAERYDEVAEEIG